VNSDGTTIYQTVIEGNDCRLIFVDISTTYDFQKMKFSDSIPTACLIVFSITVQRSFSKLNFYQEIIRLKYPNQPILIIGNKIDLEQDRDVSQQSIDKLKSHGYDVFDISVKGNVGIGDAIYTVIKYLQYEQYNLLEKVKPNNACACVIA
jgi:GTPase SAR1 family protein